MTFNKKSSANRRRASSRKIIIYVHDCNYIIISCMCILFLFPAFSIEFKTFFCHFIIPGCWFVVEVQFHVVSFLAARKTTKYLLNHSPSSNGGLTRIVSHVCCSSGSSSSTFGWLAASTDYYHSTSFNPIHENAKIVAERAFCHHNVGRGRKAQATEKKETSKTLTFVAIVFLLFNTLFDFTLRLKNGTYIYVYSILYIFNLNKIVICNKQI